MKDIQDFTQYSIFQLLHLLWGLLFSYYDGKCCMCLSFRAEYSPSHEDVLKLVVLRELGWCANYTIDKRENNDFMTDFVFMNYSRNHRIIDDQQPIDDFELCNC